MHSCTITEEEARFVRAEMLRRKRATPETTGHTPAAQHRHRRLPMGASSLAAAIVAAAIVAAAIAAALAIAAFAVAATASG